MKKLMLLCSVLTITGCGVNFPDRAKEGVYKTYNGKKYYMCLDAVQSVTDYEQNFGKSSINNKAQQRAYAAYSSNLGKLEYDQSCKEKPGQASAVRWSFADNMRDTVNLIGAATADIPQNVQSMGKGGQILFERLLLLGYSSEEAINIAKTDRFKEIASHINEGNRTAKLYP